MGLRDHYGADHVLAEGVERYRTDEKIVCDPWPATLSEIEDVLGSGSESRRALFRNLQGFLAWFDRALVGDRQREVWIRGGFASTLAPQVEDLDLVVHYDGKQLALGDRWVLQVLAAQVVDVPPHRVVVTPLRDDGVEYAFDRDQEAVRSRVRTLRPETKQQVVAGWVRVIGEEEDG